MLGRRIEILDPDLGWCGPWCGCLNQDMPEEVHEVYSDCGGDMPPPVGKYIRNDGNMRPEERYWEHYPDGTRYRHYYTQDGWERSGHKLYQALKAFAPEQTRLVEKEFVPIYADYWQLIEYAENPEPSTMT